MPNMIGMKEKIRLIFPGIIGATIAWVAKEFELNMFGPLLLALFLGILFSKIVQLKIQEKQLLLKYAKFLIFLGIPFYFAKNFYHFEASNIAQFVKSSMVPIISMLIIGTLVMSLGIFFKIPAKVRNLLAVGSSICGVSAIVVCSDPMNSSADEIYESIIIVTIISLFGSFIFIPFCGFLYHLPHLDHALLTGALTPFSDFVIPSLSQMPLEFSVYTKEMTSVAVGAKTAKYIFIVPLYVVFAIIENRRDGIGKILQIFILMFLLFGITILFGKEHEKDTLHLWGGINTYLWTMSMVLIGQLAKWDIFFSFHGLKQIGISLFSIAISIFLFFGILGHWGMS